MEKSNKNDDEKKESFLKKHWGNIKKVASTLYFIGNCFIIFYLLLGALKDVLKGDLNFSVLKDFMLVVIFVIIGFLFAWLSGCEYLKKLLIFLQDKFIILFIISYSIISCGLLFYFLKSIDSIILKKISSMNLYENILFKNILFEIILFFIIGILILENIRKIKNKYYKKGETLRGIADFIYIVNFFFVFYKFSEFNIKWLILYLQKIYPNLELNNSSIIDFYLKILIYFVCIYILNTCIRNILKMEYSHFIVAFIALFLLGNISIEYFIIVQLFVSVVNHFLENTKYIYRSFYRKINKNIDYELIKNDKTKEKNIYIKLWINMGVFIFWIYLYLIENDRLGILQYLDLFIDKIFGFSFLNSGVFISSGAYYYYGNIIKENKFFWVIRYFMNYISRGANRIFFLCVIIIIFGFILALYLFIKSKYNGISFMVERDRFYKKIEYFPMNFVKKFVYTKKIKVPKTKRRNGKIKSTMYRTSRNNYRRGRKFKKPNSN